MEDCPASNSGSYHYTERERRCDEGHAHYDLAQFNMVVFGDETREFWIDGECNRLHRPDDAFRKALREAEGSRVSWTSDSSHRQGAKLRPKHADRVRDICLKHEAPKALVLVQSLPEGGAPNGQSLPVNENGGNPL